MMRRNLTAAAVIFMGFSGFTAQLLLLRELVSSFLGSELTIGFIFAAWLLWEAAGARLAGKIVHTGSVTSFALLQVLFALVVPLSVYAARTAGTFTPGEAADFGRTALFSLLILLPPGFLHGNLFPCSCALFLKTSKKPSETAVGNVYILEIIGTLAGGILFTFLFIPLAHGFRTAMIISLINCLVSSVLLLYSTKAPLRAAAAAAAGAVLSLGVIIGGFDTYLHMHAAGRLWPGSEVLEYRNSPYSTAAVTLRGGEYTWFSDRVPVITSPNPDTAETEGFAHLGLLHHPDPSSVLIIGSGAGGLLSEVLKHPVTRADYAELDPLLIELVKQHQTELIQSELEDPRVRTVNSDGRLFTLRSDAFYDAVIIGVPYPMDLQTNRLYTLEFFSLLKQRLAPKGIVLLSMPGSSGYLSEEMADINSMIIHTLEQVFPYRKSIPGDSSVLHIASGDARSIEAADTEELTARLAARSIESSAVTPWYISYRNDPERIRWFENSLEGHEARTNRDFTPAGVHYGTAYWLSMVSPGLLSPLRFFSSLPGLLLLGLAAAGMLMYAFLRSRVVHGCVAATGFSSMLFDLAVLYAFQALFGYVFSWIGVLAACFMAGAAFGGWFTTRRLKHMTAIKRWFFFSELWVTAAALLLGAVIMFLLPAAAWMGRELLLQLLFLLTAAAAGFSTGLQFPLAEGLVKHHSTDRSTSAGSLYAADLAGGCAAGLIGGAVLLPVIGIWGICISAMVLKLFSLVMFCAAGRNI